MKRTMHPANFMVIPLLTLLTSSCLVAQDTNTPSAGKNLEIRELNKTLQADEQKQAELLSFYQQSFSSPLPHNDTVALYLADLDAVIAVSQQQHIPYPVKLMADCRDLLRQDLRELTRNGVQAGYSFQQISETNDAYLKEMFETYQKNYRTGWGYRKAVPEFGRADYFKAIRNIFTTIVTLRVNAMPADVKVTVYGLRNGKLIASGMGKTEFIQPLETGPYIVEMSKPGYQRKLKKVVLGKYPKTITINEPLVMQ